MATWNDIEKTLNHATLEDQDRDTLEAFARVEAPASQNPAFHFRFQQAQERIRRRLDQLAASSIHSNSKERVSEKWYKKPLGIIFISVVGGVVLLLIRAVLISRFPEWFQ